jgi:hypothetical protein
MYVKHILLVLALMIAFTNIKAADYDPSSMNLATSQGQADYVRWLYFLVNGPSTGNTINGGQTTGLVDIIENILGPKALGGVLWAKGYRSCSDIDPAGSTDTWGDYTFEYASGSKSIPSHFPTTGTMDSQVTIKYQGTTFLVAEFKCSGNDEDGYIRLTSSEDSSEIETYFHKNDTNNEGYLDFYWKKGTETSAVRFQTDDGLNYGIWIVANDTTDNEYYSVAASGQKKGDADLVIIANDNGTNTTAVNTVGSGVTVVDGNNTTYGTCVNMATNSSCTFNNVPTTGNFGAGNTGAFTISGVGSLNLSSL